MNGKQPKEELEYDRVNRLNIYVIRIIFRNIYNRWNNKRNTIIIKNMLYIYEERLVNKYIRIY